LNAVCKNPEISYGTSTSLGYILPIIHMVPKKKLDSIAKKRRRRLQQYQNPNTNQYLTTS
jgi:hypothetical protein